MLCGVCVMVYVCARVYVGVLVCASCKWLCLWLCMPRVSICVCVHVTVHVLVVCVGYVTGYVYAHVCMSLPLHPCWPFVGVCVSCAVMPSWCVYDVYMRQLCAGARLLYQRMHVCVLCAPLLFVCGYMCDM